MDLNASRAEVLIYVKGENCLSQAPRIRANPEKRNKKKYCRYHNDHGHDTEDCIQLTDDIKELLKRRAF